MIPAVAYIVGETIESFKGNAISDSKFSDTQKYSCYNGTLYCERSSKRHFNVQQVCSFYIAESLGVNLTKNWIRFILLVVPTS